MRADLVDGPGRQADGRRRHRDARAEDGGTSLPQEPDRRPRRRRLRQATSARGRASLRPALRRDLPRHLLPTVTPRAMGSRTALLSAGIAALIGGSLVAGCTAGTGTVTAPGPDKQHALESLRGQLTGPTAVSPVFADGAAHEVA